MARELSEMTLEELWELFPIVLSEHKNFWKDWYLAEEKRILDFLPIQELSMHHIGSTAVNGIWAKPIVDILLEIPSDQSMDSIREALLKNGYICMSKEEKRQSFNRGYTDSGFAEQVFHLHLRYCGDNDELYFRDYMNEHFDIAKQYEALKLSLWKRYEHDRDGYTRAKGDFVDKYTRLAKMEYQGKR